MLRSAPRLVAGALIGFTFLACANPPPGAAWRASHPEATPRAPEAGGALDEVLASLVQSEPEVGVASLRLLEVASEPWRELPSEAALLAEARGDAFHAVVAERICRAPGFRGPRTRRASWLLFRSGRLVAYDHWEFDGQCAPEHRFRPVPSGQRDLERALTRHLGRRFPASALDPEATFRKGLAYLEHGRVEEAEAMLSLGERALAAATRQAEEAGAAPGADATLVGARARAGELRRALRRERGLHEDPSERFWKGD